MGVRLEPQDEYLHELGPETTFNESMYFNLYDPAHNLGGFFRLANRANEGRGEMTVCLYLPDGRVGFMFQRPAVHHNDAFDAAGMRFDVVTPFEELTVRYDGKVVLLDDPLAMADPRAAFTENPYAPCRADITYTRVSDMVGGEPDQPHERPGEEFAKGHYEQLVRAAGTISVGDDTWTVDGFGLRDHSWGPRTWQAPWYYRWLTGNAGNDFGFMASRIARQDRDGTRGGFVWEDGVLHLCHHSEIATVWVGDTSHIGSSSVGAPSASESSAIAGPPPPVGGTSELYHQEVHALLRSGDREWQIKGKVLNLIPLRNRRDGLVTRISEGLTEWHVDGKPTGYGLSEYLDQIVDGQPVGIDE